MRSSGLVLAASSAKLKRADMRAEINAAAIKMILAQVAVAGMLFAALKLIP